MPSISESLELTPKDLRNFNKKMTDEILQAQKDGWRGHVNRQGHVSMLAPDGEDTVVISSNSNAINQLQLGINRYRRRTGKPVDDYRNKPKEKAKVDQKWPCARPECPKVYATAEQLNVHIQVDHEKRIKCPDCNKTFKAANVVGRHRQLEHGYVSPNKAKRKAQEAKREQKKLNAEGKLTEEQRAEVQAHVMGDVEKVLPSAEDVKLLMKGGMDEESARKFLQGSEEVSTGSKLIDDHIRRHSDETASAILDAAEAHNAHEAKELIGRDEYGNHIPDGVKFDPHFVGKFIEQSGHEPIIRDQMDEKDLIKSEDKFSLKHAVDHIPSPADIYRQTANQLNSINNTRKADPGLLSLDLEPIMDMDVRDVARVLSALGLKLELSVERKD